MTNQLRHASPPVLSVEQQGLDLARAQRDHIRRFADGTWVVPDGARVCIVRTTLQTCTCTPASTCAHRWAVAYLTNEVTLLDGTRLVRPAVTDAQKWLLGLLLAVGT